MMAVSINDYYDQELNELLRFLQQTFKYHRNLMRPDPH